MVLGVVMMAAMLPTMIGLNEATQWGLTAVMDVDAAQNVSQLSTGKMAWGIAHWNVGAVPKHEDSICPKPKARDPRKA